MVSDGGDLGDDRAIKESSAGEPELPLAGGNMGPVHRRGDTVLRAAGAWTPAVHRLLAHCRDRGFRGLPEPLGFTSDGREVVGYLPGEVPNDPLPSWIWSTEALETSTALLREFHAASVDADRRGPWRSPVREPVEVVCHNDVAPYNLVYLDGRATGMIDFDYASPGPRIWDLAYLGYRLAPLTTDRTDGFDDDERLARLDRLRQVYGVPYPFPELLATVIARLEHLAEFSDAMAVELDHPELAEHARLYRYDARYVADVLLPGLER
jgi:hypothetical protein